MFLLKWHINLGTMCNGPILVQTKLTGKEDHERVELFPDMNCLHIEVSPNASFALEGEFGNVSFNGLDHALAAKGRTDPSDRAALSYPVHRLSVLGQGSSSVVYKSVMLNKLRVTAEKVFLVGDSKKQLQMFRELQSLKSVCSLLSEEDGLEHSASPYIVELLDVFSNPTDGTLSLCLEYMNCGSLENIVQSGGCLDERVLSSITFQMTSGLNFLHERRMIHRDVKPSNALVAHDGSVKLADFGLARTLDHGQSLANSFVGTFLYMAPERLTGESYSFQSDIWSLGLTIHAVALGQFPYIGKKGYWEVLNATQQGAPAVDRSYSQALRVFLRQCYQPRAQDRPSTAALLSEVFLNEAEGTIPADVRHQVCRVLSDPDTVETVAPGIVGAPVVETHLAAVPQSAPCTGTGNLTYRPKLESKSARKAPNGSTQHKTPAALSSTARTALVMQHQTQHLHRAAKHTAVAVTAREPSKHTKTSTAGANIITPQRNHVNSSKAPSTKAVAAPRGATAGTARTESSAAQTKGPPKLTHSASDRGAGALVGPAAERGMVAKFRSVSARPAKATDAVATPKPGRKGAVRYGDTENESGEEGAVEVSVPSVSHSPTPGPSRSDIIDAKNSSNGVSEPELVRAWEKYVILAREHQVREDAKQRTAVVSPEEGGHTTSTTTVTTTTPPPKEKECYDYNASPSIAVNSLRRLIAKQHDSREVFVTEAMVQRLAAAVPCDASALREEFCAALERINRVWEGRAVQRISAASSAGNGSAERRQQLAPIPGEHTVSPSGACVSTSTDPPGCRAAPWGLEGLVPVEESKTGTGDAGQWFTPPETVTAESLEVDEELSVDGQQDGFAKDCDSLLDESIEEDSGLLLLHLGQSSDQHLRPGRSLHPDCARGVYSSKPTQGIRIVGGNGGAETKAGLQFGGYRSGNEGESDEEVCEDYANESFEADEEE